MIVPGTHRRGRAVELGNEGEVDVVARDCLLVKRVVRRRVLVDLGGEDVVNRLIIDASVVDVVLAESAVNIIEVLVSVVRVGEVVITVLVLVAVLLVLEIPVLERGKGTTVTVILGSGDGVEEVVLKNVVWVAFEKNTAVELVMLLALKLEAEAGADVVKLGELAVIVEATIGSTITEPEAMEDVDPELLEDTEADILVDDVGRDTLVMLPEVVDDTRLRLVEVDVIVRDDMEVEE